MHIAISTFFLVLMLLVALDYMASARHEAGRSRFSLKEPEIKDCGNCRHGSKGRTSLTTICSVHGVKTSKATWHCCQNWTKA